MQHHPTILLIDDDTDDQEIFSLALEKANESVNCVFANDGIEALQKLNDGGNFIPDYIFIDMNMPRMNGQQCLAEIKKINRLKNVPVYMYSTSADPASVAENKSLGATDFIVKPANINALSNILSKIIQRQLFTVMFLVFCISVLPQRVFGQTDTLFNVSELKKFSVEQLMNLEVTSVSKTPEKLSEVASAIQVVTGEEIKRSGALRLPGALRLATNMQVSSSGAHTTKISARGFNGFPVANSSLANKLLVLIDGRTVYTPLFGGVYWDVQNVLQEDIKQIEVISGPGGTLWGANAVNGIVNVITKSATETQGLYVSAASGTSTRDFGAIRYGSHVDSALYFRVYAQRYDFNSTTLNSGADAKDAWNITQGGFRMDIIPFAKNNFTLQGDLYSGKEDDTLSTYVNGQNIIGRWTSVLSPTSGINAQAYFDRTYRNIDQANGSIDELLTYDIDVQHNFSLGKRNKIVYGLGYRLADDHIRTTAHTILPEKKALQLYSGFVQDQIAIVPQKLELTLGTKVLHNDYTDFEFQPTIRLAWTPTYKHTVWSAVSRAVRTPTRLDQDINTTSSFGLGSSGHFESEKVIAYELGYRVRPLENISFSLAGFYNQYTDLRSIDTNYTPPPGFYFGNNLEATTYGFEASARVIATSWWKLRGGYSYLNEDFAITSASTLPQSYLFEAIDPKNQFLIQSMMDVFKKQFQIDAVVRYVDLTPKAFNLPAAPSYVTFDMRLAWNYRWLSLSVVGQNLAQESRASGSIKIPRSVYGRITINL